MENKASVDLSLDYIRNHPNEIDWSYVSDCITLPEDFIREFQDKVIWKYISIDQKLSKDFIREFQDNIDYDLLVRNHNSCLNYTEGLDKTTDKILNSKISYDILKDMGACDDGKEEFRNIFGDEEYIVKDVLRKIVEENPEFDWEYVEWYFNEVFEKENNEND